MLDYFTYTDELGNSLGQSYRYIIGFGVWSEDIIPDDPENYCSSAGWSIRKRVGGDPQTNTADFSVAAFGWRVGNFNGIPECIAPFVKQIVL